MKIVRITNIYTCLKQNGKFYPDKIYSSKTIYFNEEEGKENRKRLLDTLSEMYSVQYDTHYPSLQEITDLNFISDISVIAYTDYKLEYYHKVIFIKKLEDENNKNNQ